MKVIEDATGEIINRENFMAAWEGFSRRKHKRRKISRYEKDIDDNISRLMDEAMDESWQPQEYDEKISHGRRKDRLISKTKPDDHVMEWAYMLPWEKQLYDYIYDRCPAVKPSGGTHAYMRMLRNDLARNEGSAAWYYFILDAHHYFQLIDQSILERIVCAKFADGPMRRMILKVVHSAMGGIVLGIKFAQLLGLLYLADFDRLAIRAFDILKNPEKYHYWQARYVSEKIMTCRTEADAVIINKGVDYLNRRFDYFVRHGCPFYSRFVDNIMFVHEDKTFLRIMRDIAIMVLTRDYHITINSNYNIRPVADGIPAVGYFVGPLGVRLSKYNKQNLAREVAKLRKKGLSDEQIRIKCASRLGFAKHANVNHLFKKLNMEKSLGKIIRDHRIQVPFDGMSYRQKESFKKIVYDEKLSSEKEKFKIMLMDYVILDSKIEKETIDVAVNDSEGNPSTIKKTVPRKVLAIRYKKITDTVYFSEGEEKYTFAHDDNGNDAEFFSYTGSSVLIDQARKDFSREDLPAPTVIQKFVNVRTNKEFFKFT